MDDERTQQIKDEEHLRLLWFGYLISAGVTALFSLFGLIYVFVGLMFSVFLRHLPQSTPEAPPEFIGWFFIFFGGMFVVVGLVIATLKWWAARLIKARRSPMFCYIVAGITCLGIPYGTLLGVCTFIVLSRPSIARQFAARSQASGVGVAPL